MPFGLRNASNTFHQKIDRVKQALSFCFAYQDDLEVAIGCALTFTSEAKFETQVKISFHLEAKKKPDFT